MDYLILIIVEWYLSVNWNHIQGIIRYANINFVVISCLFQYISKEIYHQTFFFQKYLLLLVCYLNSLTKTLDDFLQWLSFIFMINFSFLCFWSVSSLGTYKSLRRLNSSMIWTHDVVAVYFTTVNDIISVVVKY